MSELKPCPFCGGEAYIQGGENEDCPWFIDCNKCQCEIEYFSVTKQQAIDAWNERKLIKLHTIYTRMKSTCKCGKEANFHYCSEHDHAIPGY